jgi:SAM-dependent methyltransferase
MRPPSSRRSGLRQAFPLAVAKLLAALLLITPALTLNAQSARAESPASEAYEYRAPSRDGIGKVYLGREISHVMGHMGAAWLERPSRQREERTDRLVRELPLAPGSVVADIGAGTGYFSFRIAERIPTGKVIAVDIQQEMLDLIEARKSSGYRGRIETVLGTERDPGLAESSVDLILLVDAYHEFSWPLEMGQAMARALRPGGRLVLIEYRGEDRSVPIKRLHKMTEAQARMEMESVGLDLEYNADFLPQQHFLVFRRPGHRDARSDEQTSHDGPDAAARNTPAVGG